MTDHAGTLRYRADIDGLRAIAVAAVVLFHAGVPFLGGGYVGVDVFFVISGYLITSILLKDASWLRFYQRRARRILPALFAMIAALLLAGLWLLLPADYMKVATSAAATVGFVSNFHFWRQAGYFQPAVELMPLLHTWSLGVEEQFYIVFPWVLIAGRRLKRTTLIVILAVLALISLGGAAAGIQLRQATAVFYLLPTRAWELLVGSLLAAGLVPAIRQAWLRAALAAAGLAALLWPILVYTDRTHFPGLAALPPVLGSAAVIAAGMGGRHRLSPLLEAKPVVALGLVSYSLYLWHWPVLALWRYHVVHALTPVEATAAVLLSLMLAILSWRFVEQPFRRGYSDRAIWIMSGIGIAAVLAAAGAIHLGRGLPQRFPRDVVALNEYDGATWRCPLNRMYRFGDTLACRVSRNADATRVILWGDSHAQMYAPAFLDGDDGVVLINAYSCAPVVSPQCAGKQASNYRAIVASPAQTVIMALNWPQYRYQWQHIYGGPTPPDREYQPLLPLLAETVAGLRQAGKRVILVAPVPRPNYEVASILSRETAFGGPARHPWSQPISAFREDFARVHAALDELARQPGVTVVDPAPSLCSGGVCRFAVPGRSFFSDYGHLTTEHAATLRPLFAGALARSAADRR